MKFNTGDLVQGSKPWHCHAHYGIVLNSRPSLDADTGLFMDSFEVFWISPEHEVKQFTTWEVESSVWKWSGENERR